MTKYHEAIRSAQYELMRMANKTGDGHPDTVTLNRVVRLLDELERVAQENADLTDRCADLEEQLRGARGALTATPRSVYGRTL